MLDIFYITLFSLRTSTMGTQPYKEYKKEVSNSQNKCSTYSNKNLYRVLTLSLLPKPKPKPKLETPLPNILTPSLPIS
jgi:hypothetical protein